MLRGIILSLAVVALSAFIQAQPATYLSNLPNCFAYAGENATKVVNDRVHFTYLSRDNGNVGRIIYAQETDDGQFIYNVVDSGVFFQEGTHYRDKLKGSPTLEISDGIVNIAYNKDDCTKLASSPDNGQSFTITDLDIAMDTLPVIKDNGGGLTAFLTHYDMFSEPGYHVFNNTDYSTNNTPCKYWGADVLDGVVRSNSDIFIAQLGAGINNGWPLFYAPVITSGQIFSSNGTPIYGQIFRGGYSEHAPQLKLDISAWTSSIRASGMIVGPADFDTNRIMMVNVNGNTYSSWIGLIVPNGFDSLAVWTSYPLAGTPLYYNVFPHIDTLWTPGPMGLCRDQMMVNSELWISGNFQGKQVWYSTSNIKLTDNISLTGVPMGTDIPSDCQNYVALVSDRNILVQYGYWSPADSLRHKPNCGSSADGIFIYASLYACNEGSSTSIRDDGNFSFEYQHPHPSMPDYNYQGTLYDKIDLHRRTYPQTTANPWPANIDYPYYNPLWPEARPYMERGTIHLYGSVYQQRRGYTHRSYFDSEYPNPNLIWDIENDLCGGTSNVSYNDTYTGIYLESIDTPGTMSNGVGYYKDYHNDARLTYKTFGGNPFGLGIRLKNRYDNYWSCQFYKSLNEPIRSKSLIGYGDNTIIQYNNHFLKQVNPLYWPQEINLPLHQNDEIQGLSEYNFIQILRNNPTEMDTFLIMQFYPDNNEASIQYSKPVFSKLNCTIQNFSCPGALCLQADGTFTVEYALGDGVVQGEYDPQIPELDSMQVNLEKSRIYDYKMGYLTSKAIIYLANQEGTGGKLYFAYIPVTEVANEDVYQTPAITSVRSFPNPFKEHLSVAINSNKTLPADILVYNLKGQLVRTLQKGTILTKGKNTINWDGKNDAGIQTSSGIYFIHSKIGDKAQINKVLRIK